MYKCSALGTLARATWLGIRVASPLELINSNLDLIAPDCDIICD